MNKIYLSETYKNIYSLPIGMKAINNKLRVGPVSIPEFKSEVRHSPI